MRKIINPWLGKGIFTCFGCSENSKFGLHMDFYEDGEQVICNWMPSSRFEGYVNTLHGGIQSTMHDEIASWVIYVKGETAGVTTDLKVKFLKGVLVDEGEIKITGEIIEQDRRFIKVKTQLFNNRGELGSEAEVTYRIFSQQMAIEKMYYPGVDAFFEK